MKVFIITREPFPNGMAATNRIKCYAKAILSSGMECIVLNFARTEKRKFNRNEERVGTADGIPYIYMGRRTFRNSNRFLGHINDLLDKWRLRIYLKKHLVSGDVVFGYAGRDVNFIISIIKLVHAKGAFYVRDLCELPYGTGKETSWAIKNRKKVLTQQFPICDGIISISESLYNLSRVYVPDQCQLIKIPIMVDYEKHALADYSNESEIPYIFHSGTLYEQKDGILGMIEAFGIASQKLKKDIRFVSTNKLEKSPHASEIKRLIAKYNLERKIIFTGYLTDDELKHYLSYASLVIINKYQTQQNFYCFSTKLGEYLAAEKPVIITQVGEAMNWLENKKNACIVKPGDANQLAGAIIEMMNNPLNRHYIAKNGKELCKDFFDYRVYGEKLESFFNSLKK